MGYIDWWRTTATHGEKAGLIVATVGVLVAVIFGVAQFDHSSSPTGASPAAPGGLVQAPNNSADAAAGIPPVADTSVLASTNTSLLPSTATGSPPASATYLSDMLPLENQHVGSVYGTYPTSIDGGPYVKSVILKTDSQGPQSLEYVLSGQFKAFSAVLGVQDLAGEPHGPVVCHWRVLVDGREIVVGDSQRGAHIDTGSVDISGGVHLKIEVTATSGSGYPGDYAPCTAGDALLA